MLQYFDPDPPPKGFPRSSLTALMQRRFPVDRIEAAVTSRPRWDDSSGGRLLSLVPTEHRARIARALAGVLAPNTPAAVDILKTFGRELVDVLVDIAALPTGRSAARAVWEVAPDVARVHLETDYDQGRVTPWISAMPEERLGELVELVEQRPKEPVPDELRFWLSRRLPEAGPEADRIWALLQRAGEPSGVEVRRPA